MLALVCYWRPDTASARRLYGFSDALEDGDVVKAVEQVRHQRRGRTDMPPWLRALDGFALADAVQYDTCTVQDAAERAVLEALVDKLNARPDAPIACYADGADLIRQLRLRMLVCGMPGEWSADWESRVVDGSSWQPRALADEPEAFRALLALADEAVPFDPWVAPAAGWQAPVPCAQWTAQAEALLQWHRRGWL